MWDAGWFDEARALRGLRKPMSKTAAEATGYQEIYDYFLQLGPSGVIERIKIATRQLARKQMKWLKRFKNVHWIAGDAPLEEQLAQVLARWP